ncbi:hypothetical protein [Caulobacter sp. LARHSG274]
MPGAIQIAKRVDERPTTVAKIFPVDQPRERFEYLLSARLGQVERQGVAFGVVRDRLKADKSLSKLVFGQGHQIPRSLRTKR